MKYFKAEGIVIDRRNYLETDKVITLFTKEYGKKVLLAKGIRQIKSRRAPHLELFSHINVLVNKGKKWDTITEVNQIEVFEFVRKRLERIGYMFIISEIINKLTADNQSSRLIFDELLKLLKNFNNPGYLRTQASHDLFNFKRLILKELGFSDDNKIGINQIDYMIEDLIETKIKSNRFLTTLQKTLYN